MRLLSQHPDVEVVAAGALSHAGESVGSLYPSLRLAWPDLVFEDSDPERFRGLDLVFLALPHGAAEGMVREIVGNVGVIVDLSADFRLKDPLLYRQFYGRDHGAPELLEEFAYGLPELFRTSLQGASLVAAPGCYPTAAALALSPLVSAGAVEPHGVVVDAASGVSGAGSSLSPATQFSTAEGDFRAYGLLRHRHTPEIEQATGAQVLFTPHLAPMARGILATCYARPRAGLDTSGALEILGSAYAGEPFISVRPEPPSTKATLGSNSAHLSVVVDDRTGWLVVMAAIDNLVKGAAGQAIQCANLALGLPETRGLPVAGVFP